MPGPAGVLHFDTSIPCYILIHLSKLLVSCSIFFLAAPRSASSRCWLPARSLRRHWLKSLSPDLPGSPSLPPTLRLKGRCLGLQVQLQETASFISTWRKTTTAEGVPCKSAGGRRRPLAFLSREQRDKDR